MTAGTGRVSCCAVLVQYGAGRDVKAGFAR